GLPRRAVFLQPGRLICYRLPAITVLLSILTCEPVAGSHFLAHHGQVFVILGESTRQSVSLCTSSGEHLS
ncbi:MAG: hypothetical protein OSB47_01145, partial [Pirellulaceae bacterium]|nr:hypothetical protein [Pirellulaceae bacterium]